MEDNESHGPWYVYEKVPCVDANCPKRPAGDECAMDVLVATAVDRRAAQEYAREFGKRYGVMLEVREARSDHTYEPKLTFAARHSTTQTGQIRKLTKDKKEVGLKDYKLPKPPMTPEEIEMEVELKRKKPPGKQGGQNTSTGH